MGNYFDMSNVNKVGYCATTTANDTIENSFAIQE